MTARVRRPVILAVAVFLSTASCDQGEQKDERSTSPPLVLLAANVGPTQPLRADGSIELVFNRYLSPATTTRQSAILRDAFDNVLTPVVTYDPVTRTVRLSSPNPAAGNWMLPDQPYRLIFPVPSKEFPYGFRAIDGATLPELVVISFRAATPPASGDSTPSMRFCSDVFPVLSARCATCHGGTRPAAGLGLDSGEAIDRTAKGRVAIASNTGPRAGVSAPPGGPFGVDMARIEPGVPGASWLLYTLLADPPPASADDTPRCDREPQRLRDSFAASPASDDERARLREVVGGHLPHTASSGMSPEQLRRVSAWIQEGAKTEACACRP